MEMSLRINSDTERVITQRNHGLATAAVSRAMERLTSGYRINRASDDASGLAISEGMRAQVRGLAQNQRNIQDGISLVQTAEAALSGIHEMLQRIRELTVQYKNGTMNAGNQSFIENEIATIAGEIERTGRMTAFNGIDLLSNTGGVTFQVGADDGQVIVAATISLAATLGSAYKTLGGAGDLDEIDAAIETIATQRGVFGAVQNRLETALANVRIGQENLVATESRIRDVDVAGQVIELTKGQIFAQSSQAMLAQANQSSQTVLTLIR
jgi:flagellin